VNEAGPAGAHVLLDYVDYVSPVKEDGEWVLAVLRDSARKLGVLEVHSHVESFDGSSSPPGFASVVLIDESHLSAHCYSDRGLLAIDIFTCGNHDPDSLADLIHKKLVSEIPTLRIVFRHRIERFRGD
jgi:S-adenosylmethionine decarboxylase